MTEPLQGLPDPAAVAGALERVYARPEFRPPEPGLLDGVWARVGAAIRGIFGWVWGVLDAGASGALVAYLAIALMLAAAAWIAVRWIRSSSRDPGASARRKAGAVVTRAPARGPREPIEAAARLAAAGRFVEAAHALYEGAILWLDDARHARFDPSKTGGEYAREIRPAPLAGAFRALLRAYYPVAFGGRPDAKGAFDRMREAADAMGVPR